MGIIPPYVNCIAFIICLISVAGSTHISKSTETEEAGRLRKLRRTEEAEAEEEEEEAGDPWASVSP